MKVVIAIDSLKGSLSSLRAGEATAEGIRRVFPQAECRIFPVADGGEGTVEALAYGLGGRFRNVTVTGPLGNPVEAKYAILENGTAVMEMSAAAGITLLPPEARDPMKTTTYGVGEMILDAIGQGCRSFLMGIGGSATNDGGIGMLQALGFDLTDADGAPVPFGAQGVRAVAAISDRRVAPSVRECTFRIACDVTNPLCGQRGCSAVYGPQKGAKPEDVPVMDDWLSAYGDKIKALYPAADKNAPGAGAAGGIGFAFLACLGGELRSGIELVLAETGMEAAIREADVVVTGEGRLDAQTVMGKAPHGVAKLAKAYGKPVLGISGCVTDDARAINGGGIDAFFPIVKGACTLEEAMDVTNAHRNMADTAEQMFRLIKTFAPFD
ncbi:MAG: glycerate kinase [Clostridia bacterium]|nr:glycerate kinase [Clostridia bacterium]